MELRNIASVQLEAQGYTEELGKNEGNSIHRLQQLRAELEECHRQKILKLKETYVKEVNTKYKKDREQIRNDLTTANSEVHEREHDHEIGELIVLHDNEIAELHTKLMEQQQLLAELRQQMEATHLEEMQQAEAVHNLKLEALRLSSNNIHTSQLEMMQTNLRKEKETALMELREMLNDKHAQEVAVMQGRYHFELEHIKEQNQKEKEELALKHQYDIDKERKEIALEMEEKHAQMLENLKGEWASNTEISLKYMSEELSVRHRIELNEMKRILKAEAEEVKGRLECLSLEKEQAEKLKEQLLARTSHMEEMECLKKDFQLRWDKKRSEHENELEQLRLYFEEKLKSVEENYREELTMLHQRLQEVKDYSLLGMENSQDQRVELCTSTTHLEVMTDKERRDLFEQLTQQLEHHKEEICCLQLHLDTKHRREVELLRSSLTLQYQESIMKMKVDLSDRYTSEIEQLKSKHCLSLEQLRANISEEHLQEIAKLRLQSAQDAARQIEAEVAERLLVLENEYKAKLGGLQVEMQSISTQQEEILILRKENTDLKEIGVWQEMHLKEELEQIECKLTEDHANELRRTREEVQEMEQTHKAEAEEWKQEQEGLEIKTEEKISLLCEELENKAEYEKQALQKQFELHEAGTKGQQAARIIELEKSLKEQQNSVQQLEDSLVHTEKTLAQYDSELTSTKALMTEELEKAKQVLEEEYKAKLQDAQSRFMDDGKAMTKKITREHELLLQELREKHVGELELQSKELQQKHKEHILSLTSDLQTKHQAEIETLKSTLERKQKTWLETHVADMQNNHQAQITELETKHLSNLNTLETTYLSEIQLLRDEHKQALEGLQVDLREQLLQKDKANQMLLVQELDGMKLKYAEELQLCQDNLKIQLETVHLEKLKIMATELEEAHKGEILHMEEQHKKTIQEYQDLHISEVKKDKENCQQLQKELKQLNSDKEQLEEKTKYFNKEMEDAGAELKNLLQERNRENREGETLIALLRSDIKLYKNEREKLQESYQQALKLLLKMVKTTKDTEDLIYKKIGLCPDDNLASGDSGESQIMIGETVLTQKLKTMEKWSIKKSNGVGQGKVYDQTLPEHSVDSSVPYEISELSEHLCESIFENPDLIFENEERIHKIGHGLHIAVEKLLELVAESTKQLEETHTSHIYFEEEFKRRKWEACQMVNEHHELMDCFNEENMVKNQLVLELHKARGFIEGYLAERLALEQALNLKEESESRLIVELESLKAQVQELTQEHARSVEDQKLLIISQNKALAANVGEREVDLIKEIEHLTKAKSELKCQAEKDCSTLNAQMKILEMELDEQLTKNQNLAMMSLEVADFRQQIQALERQLKNQRIFMDKQAVEWENERDEFQEEIRKLEMELKLTTKCQASGQSSVYLVESLHNELKERTEDYNRLFLDREQIQKALAVRNEKIGKLEARIRELECINGEEAKNANKLIQELQKLKKMEAELKQDKEALQQQQYNNLIQISTLQSKLDEARHRMLTEGTLDNVILKAQEELIIEKKEVANLLEKFEQFKENLMNKNEEVLQLSSKLEVEKKVNVTKIIQLKEENAHLNENIKKITMQSQNIGDSQLAILQFLMSLLEEKNQETDHLNEQIVRLEHKIENSKENEILEKQMLEIEDMKSVIEHLNGDKEQLLRDKTEEIERLHRVIEKQQKELALLAPMCHEAGDGHDYLNNFALVEQEENHQNKLKKGSLNHLVESSEDDNYLLLNSSQNQLQGQLEIVLADRETLQQLPEEKQSQFKTEVEILEQNLQNVQETSRQQFTELTALQLQYKELQEEHKLLKMCLSQRETEMTMTTTCIQELEDKLRERETKVLERELQLQIVSEQNAEQTVEVQHIKENVQLENELHVLAQTLHDKEAIYQREVIELQSAVAELKSQTEKKVEELETLRSERDLFHSQLKSYMEKDQNNDQKETKLHKLVPKLGAFVPSEETEEEGEESTPSNKLSVSVRISYNDQLEKDTTVTDLKSTSKNLNIQDKNLQGIVLIQEAEINTVKKQQNIQPLFQHMWQLNHLSQSTQLAEKIMDNFQHIVMDKTSWDSPEIMRKQNSMELLASLPLTPVSEVDGMHSIGFESLCPENSFIQGNTPGLLECPISYSSDNKETAASLFQSSAFPGSTFSVTEYNGVPENISVRDAEGFTLMPPELQDDLRSTMSRLENASTENGSNTSSDLVLQLNWEEPETTIHQDGNAMAYLQCVGMVSDVSEPAMKEKELFSQQLKNVLKMVYEESYKILVLSEKSLPLDDDKNVEQVPSVERWRRERLTLLDTVQSLKDYLNKVSAKEEQEKSSAFFDWRGELLQAVQCVLEKERNVLQSYLQSHFHNSGSGDKGSLVEKLERIVEQQEQQQKIVLEHLLSSDRNSLLTEIQDLEAQLRLMHLQSQEKLQQLQETLINTENHGSKQEHQLRRQVELLEYKLQQEKSIASDLQASLQSEQDKASEMHELLKQEHTAILNLKSELCENKQTNEKLEKSLQELQKEVIKYRSALENKEKGIIAVFQDLQNEQLKEKELQNMLDEQQHQHKMRDDEKSKAIEELQAALELQCIQNNQLSVALEHEQSANSNLHKELQIEHSRCEALLSQDQNKLLELQKNIDVEKNHSLELLSALNHERVLTEQLSMRINECGSCKHKDLLQELQAQLYIERSYARELLAIIEKTRQQALNSKKQMDEMQQYCEEPQKEQNYTSLQLTQATLQNQKQDIIHVLKIQREKEAQMKKEWEQLQPILRAPRRDQENRTEQAVRERRQEQQTEYDKLKELQEAQGSQHEFKVQHWQNTGRIKELQQKLEDLKGQEKIFNYHKNQHKPTSCPSENSYSNLSFTTDTVMPHVEQQKLENIREQLLFAAAYLSEFIYKTVDKTIKWPASNDEVVAVLLHILQLKAELLASSKPLVIPTCIINSMQESEGIACQEEKSVLQNGLKATENDATKTDFVMENKSTMASSNLKMQKLYRKYLRAESFRKALVYQKKYLLLLLGGFQECEQATLSLIARMGIYPSPTDLNVSESRNRYFTKFRSAVRVVIAISRLKFLMKKWHKVGRKEMTPEAISPTIAHNSYPRARTEVLKQQQPFPGNATKEAGYCNRSNLMRLVNCSPKSPHHLHNRFCSASQASSKDPEHSLTEYIAHLEAIQQRLGILMPGQSQQ